MAHDSVNEDLTQSDSPEHKREHRVADSLRRSEQIQPDRQPQDCVEDQLRRSLDHPGHKEQPLIVGRAVDKEKRRKGFNHVEGD